MRVLRQPPVAYFGKTELAFHDAEDVLDFGAHTRLIAIPAAFGFGQFPVATAPALGEVPRPGRMIGDGLCLAGIGRITPYPRLFAMQQLTDHDRVVHICRGGNDGMHQLGVAVDADMRLGIMRSISSRNRSLWVFLRYFSKPSVSEVCFISRYSPKVESLSVL